MPFEVRTDLDGTLVVSSADQPAQRRLDAQIDLLVELLDGDLVFDMSRVDHLNSSGIRCVQQLEGTLKRAGKHMVIQGMSPQLAEVLNASRHAES